MRGKDNLRVIVVGDFRITPAYAGKRDALSLREFEWRDHPRLCGEKMP